MCLFIIMQACGFVSKDLSITPLNKKKVDSENQRIEYSNYWQAIQNLAFSHLKQDTLTKDQENFANGVKLILNADYSGAGQIFNELLHESRDLQIKKYSYELLVNVLFLQSDWQSLMELYRFSQNGENKTGSRELFSSFASLEPEIYLYPVDPVVIPIEISTAGIPVIEVKINGKKKKFWIDTGTSITTIATAVAKDCGVEELGVKVTKAETGTGASIPISPAVIEKLEIGELLIKNHPTIIINRKDMRFKVSRPARTISIDGLIGWNALNKMKIEIDYRNKHAIIKKPEYKDNIERNFFWLGNPIIKVQTPQGLPLLFGLDTGAIRTFITENILWKIKPASIRGQRSKILSIGGYNKILSKIIPDLTLILNNYQLYFQNIGTRPVNRSLFISIDGVFGSDVGQDGKIVIDSMNGIIQFEYDRLVAQPRK
ncbi:MAG: hypothetical protein A2Y62_11975 [Candidatus Fischerbacteria bacterium RBG_13_37_8]|uniref:Peptidase A2 domain-containing protein n=1 Tax=Candidatus Fischerbacteria bacterium RBG_13_37_8 TaxID=1817863 RepID=A0A1F5VH46_9BACT|nr:MAG: hypothetical protein A2Y62_11975 [Candidatus Fischerbacteria bacterium RBG_13_37_8]